MTRSAFDRRVPPGRFHEALERSRAGLGAAGAMAALTSGLLFNVIPNAWIAALIVGLVSGALASYVIDPGQADDL